jgi:hypothetical protein
MDLDPVRKDICNFNIGRSKYGQNDYTSAIEFFSKIDDPD